MDVAANTHLAIDPRLCGEPRALAEGRASVRLETTREMAADERGLIHGGFVFGAADYAAMLAVNDPNVVLGKAEIKFLKPVVVGETITATASVLSSEGIKRNVHIEVVRGDDVVMAGEMLCLVPDHHVLE